MRFGEPLWLAIAAGVIVLLLFLFRRFRKSRRLALQKFVAGHLLQQLMANVSERKRFIKNGLLVTGFALCLIALARPQLGFRWEETTRKGIDILIAVDTSRSMLAQDVNPNRLTRAKMAVLDLVAKLPGDRVGLIAFAGSAFLQCPLTLDYDAFRQSLEALDTSTIPKGGTDISSAIKEAEKAFSLATPTHKILILITDGEDLEASGVSAARDAAQNGMKIYTVGVGTPTGELIPLSNNHGVEFVKDEGGQIVKSRLDESTLHQIAANSGGLYHPLGQRGEGLDTIYEQGLSTLPKQELSARMNRIYIERFQWPLSFAISILVIEFLVSDRRKIFKPFRFRLPKIFKRKALPGLLFFISFNLWASPQSAEKAYQKGKFSEAETLYKKALEKKPHKPELLFNTATAAYKTGHFSESMDGFQKALNTDQIPLQQEAFYNLGNAQYRIGQQTEKTDPKSTIQSWQNALHSYEGALQLKSDDKDARFNYELVKKNLEKLQKEQPKEQEKEKDQNKDQDKEKDKEKEKKDQKDEQKKEEPKPSPNQDKSKPDQEKEKQQQQQSPKDEQQPKTEQKEEPKPAPGQMTKEDAQNLLDSLKGDEKKMPLVPLQNQLQNQQDPKRDW
jgi:Ca-activated chloride channel homolog